MVRPPVPVCRGILAAGIARPYATVFSVTPAEVAEALFKVNLPQAVAGPLNYTSTNVKTNPAPGVAITPPVGIQWQKGTTYPLEAKVVDNTLQPLA